ncbi:hypothetical protein Celal_3284 [Cellulophaga algicola DSM 14237]|uniref:Uncharacterized protein n=1 Tax=Cellulophaga algicola (strain DSM 14237 / IC166 / ACAM 630) TaxID=688270 RepID=E6X5J5_CELAD|nr:hypothetical protein [Cellulophaga algicola]ADV50550.1 hypothetical protein Celal_3284 [Cellulophaga algicola DSM 14237]
MEAYTKKIDNLEIKMLVDTNLKEQKTFWNIYVYNSKKDSVLIDHFEYSKIYEKEQEYISGDIRKHIIIGDVILEHKTIYLMLYKHGKTYLNTYEFTDDKKFIKNEYFGGSIRSGSYVNYGHPLYLAEIKPITENELFIYLAGGTEMSSGVLPMQKFNNLSKKLTRIIFNENSTKKIENNEKLFETLVLEQNKEKIGTLIKKILIENNHLKINDNFKYLGFLDRSNLKKTRVRSKGLIYFFFQEKSINSNIKIIKYNISKSEWLIADFKEERIKSEE